ncbi:hypothetical protein [Carboxylicivirga caseinilyticus]|uniref:hypothetical protein n=1 Tax=Carboxylicivirga caseinilyticus TaxID=3417572 RepID=UPI003D342EC4|nr:hypothetical protein [Marinilabiliaceae bacterium A049]
MKTANTERIVRDFVKEQEEKVKLHQSLINESYWQMALQVQNEDSLLDYFSLLLQQHSIYQELQSCKEPLFNDFSDFEFLKKVRESGVLKDKLLLKQVDELWKLFLASQLGYNKIEEQRADILKQLFELNQRTQKAWRKNDSLWMYYQSNILNLHSGLKKLVLSSNDFATQMGYNNYFSLILEESKMNELSWTNMIASIDSITRSDYIVMKKESEKFLCDSLGLKRNVLTFKHYDLLFKQCRWPINWHKSISVDELKNQTNKLFLSYGLDLKHYVDKSNIYLAKNDSVGRSIVLNCDNFYDIRCCYASYNTELDKVLFMTELGEVAASAIIDESVPYFLRGPNHVVESVMRNLWGNLPYISADARRVLHLNKPEFQIAFSTDHSWYLYRLRYLLVIAQMEHEVLDNPDQNFTKLYWSLVEKYMLIKVPERLQDDYWVNDRNLMLMDGSVQYELMGAILAGHIWHTMTNEEDEKLIELLWYSASDIDMYNKIEALTKETINPAFIKGLYTEEG